LLRKFSKHNFKLKFENRNNKIIVQKQYFANDIVLVIMFILLRTALK